SFANKLATLHMDQKNYVRVCLNVTRLLQAEHRGAGIDVSVFRSRELRKGNNADVFTFCELSQRIGGREPHSPGEAFSHDAGPDHGSYEEPSSDKLSGDPSLQEMVDIGVNGRTRMPSKPTSSLCEFSSSHRNQTPLLQLRVLGFGLFQHGNVGVGIFPECEEILIGSTCFCCVALHRIGSADLQVRQCANRLV